MANNAGGSDAEKKIEEFSGECPLFASIQFPDMKILTKYCELRSASAMET
jgi:hypothetical protein